MSAAGDGFRFFRQSECGGSVFSLRYDHETKECTMKLHNKGVYLVNGVLSESAPAGVSA